MKIKGKFTAIPKRGYETNYGHLELRRDGVELFLDFIDVKGVRKVLEKIK